MWDNNRPSNRIRSNVVRAVRDRDQDLCQLQYPGCTQHYEELDHIENLAASGRPRGAGIEKPEDLQCVCRYCHNIKTQAEARAGKLKWKRKPERHPGMRW